MHQSRKRTPKEIRGSLIGTLLGDSYITQGSHFGCEQVSKNLIYLKWELLKHYKPDVAEPTSRQRDATPVDGRLVTNIKPTYTVRLRHPRFNNYYKVFYSNGNKEIRYSTLKMLSLEGIALWIMDDGYMDYKESSCTRNLRICTDSYSSLSIQNIIRYFKEVHSIDAKVYMHVNKKGATPKPRVSFNAQNAQKLISKIYSYFLDEFLYKIDLHYLDKTIKSKRCSDEYRIAAKYISERKALILEKSINEDIV